MRLRLHLPRNPFNSPCPVLPWGRAFFVSKHLITVMGVIMLRCGILGLLILCASVCEARTLIVAADSSGDFLHIAAAADSAQAGDTVLVRDGEYWGPGSNPESITVDSGVVVLAEHPGAARIMTDGIVLRGTAMLMGFEIQAYAIHSIYMLRIEGGPATLSNCRFVSNYPNSIGSLLTIAANGQPPRIRACDFEHDSLLAMVENTDSTTIWMPGNYFGTADTARIHLKIYDGVSTPGRGFVYISPVLESFEWLSVNEPATAFIPTSLAVQVWPNPFNSTATIGFALPRTAYASLRVYDLLGREVVVLVDGVMAAGEQRVAWQAAGASSGMYYVRLQAGEQTRVTKVMLLR